MQKSTTYGCHFIDQPLSSFVIRIDPSELPTHARWWIQQTSSVGGKDFLPKLWGCFKFSSFTELAQRLMTCWLLFHPPFLACITAFCFYNFLKVRVSPEAYDLLAVVPSPFSCLYYSILLLQLSGSSSETIVDTF